MSYGYARRKRVKYTRTACVSLLHGLASSYCEGNCACDGLNWTIDIFRCFIPSGIVLFFRYVHALSAQKSWRLLNIFIFSFLTSCKSFKIIECTYHSMSIFYKTESNSSNIHVYIYYIYIHIWILRDVQSNTTVPPARTPSLVERGLFTCCSAWPNLLTKLSRNSNPVSLQYLLLEVT